MITENADGSQMLKCCAKTAHVMSPDIQSSLDLGPNSGMALWNIALWTFHPVVWH